MSTIAAPDLKWKPILADTYRLYRLLFLRSVGFGLVIFGGMELIRMLAGGRPLSPMLALAIVVCVTFAGTALVQGSLAETVRDVHLGHQPPTLADSYDRATARFGPLLAVSILSGLGVGLATLFLIVPGVILLARWYVAVPIVMYEDASAREALRRSNELVRGHTREVANVVLTIGIRVGLIAFAFGFVAGIYGGFLAGWVTGTLSAALTTPFLAHSSSILYYRLTEPDVPVVPERSTWTSVWDENDEHPE